VSAKVILAIASGGGNRSMRILKLVAIVLGGLVAVLVIVLLAVRAFVNPNDYKDRIARVIKNSTGRELALPGDIRLSVFPWIALELGPASLGNPPGFGEEPFAAVKHAALRVRLLPLLRKQLEIGRVEVDGLDLRLRKNASGRGNWQSPAESSPTPQSSGSAGAAALRDLAGIVITDSRVSYQDLVAEHINLNVGRVAAGVGVPIKVKLDLVPSVGAQPIEIGGRFGLTLEPAQSRYRLAPMDLEGTFTPAAGGARPVSWKFSAPQAELDLGAQTLRVASVAVQLGAVHLSGTLRGSRIVDAPIMVGSFKLDPVALRELMTQFGIAPPKTRDPKAFSKLAASGEFAYENKQVGVSKLDVQLDDSQLRGSAAITSLETKAMDFDLTLNQIDIDRYRPPPENAPKAAAPAFAKREPPSNVLKTLEMNGRFALGAATFAGLHVIDGHMELKAKDGLTRIAPLTAKLYGGQYSGEVTLDDRGPVLASSFEQSLTGVDVARLLKDLTKSQRLSGHGTITSSLTARGKAGQRRSRGHRSVVRDQPGNRSDPETNVDQRREQWPHQVRYVQGLRRHRQWRSDHQGPGHCFAEPAPHRAGHDKPGHRGNRLSGERQPLAGRAHRGGERKAACRYSRYHHGDHDRSKGTP
jgi:AsmA protein